MTRLAFEIVLAIIIAIGPHVVSACHASVFDFVFLSDTHVFIYTVHNSPNLHTRQHSIQGLRDCDDSETVY